MDKLKQTIDRLLKAQLEKLDAEDINYDGSIREVEISTLRRPTYSSRVVIDGLLQTVITSLQTFDFLGGIFVEASNLHVIDGWHRLAIWQEMGHTTIPCYLINCSPEQERRLHLSLNTLAATFDAERFGLDFPNFNPREFGFCEADLMSSNPALEAKFRHPQRQEESGTKKVSTTLPISIYQRLMEIQQLMKLRGMQSVITALIEYYDAAN